MMRDQLQRWRALAGAGADDVGDSLVRAWARPQRPYDDQSRLRRLSERSAAGLAHANMLGELGKFRPGRLPQ
jgi:hypothetical protein